MSTRLGRLVQVNPSVPEFLDDAGGDVTFMPLECVWPDGRADTTRRAIASAVASGYTQFRDGDILLPKITPTFEAGRVFPVSLETQVGAGTTELHVLRPSADVDARFIAYLCRSHPFLREGASALQGVGNLRRVPIDFIRKFVVLIDDVETQRAVADYLDRETTQIDTLISKQEALIDRLSERRVSVVRHLTEDVPGERIRLKYVFESSSEANYPDEEVLSVYREYGVIPKASRSDNFNRTPENVERYLRVRPGDLVVNRMKAWQGSLGISPHRGIVSGDYEVARPIDTHWLSTFAHEYLRSPRMIAQYALRSTGIRPSQWRLYWDQMGDIEVPVPTRETQLRIVDELTTQTGKIDTLIERTQRFIELARERRAALITAAVTGQIDVREQVA